MIRQTWLYSSHLFAFHSVLTFIRGHCPYFHPHSALPSLHSWITSLTTAFHGYGSFLLQLDYGIPEGRAHSIFALHNLSTEVPLEKPMTGWLIEETEIGPCSDLTYGILIKGNPGEAKPNSTPFIKYAHPNKSQVIGKVTAPSLTNPNQEFPLVWIKTQSSKY